MRPEGAQERETAGYRQQEEMLPNREAALATIARGIGFGLLGRDRDSQVLQKINTAAVAGSSAGLLMAAGRATIPQGSVASRAEKRRGDRFGFTFRTIHFGRSIERPMRPSIHSLRAKGRLRGV